VAAAWRAIREKCDGICFAQEKHAQRNDKSTYIQRFREFGKFRFVKEAVCHSVEQADANRLTGLLLSQGGVQTALKMGGKTASMIQADMQAFRELAESHFRGPFDLVFSYRLRLAVK